MSSTIYFDSKLLWEWLDFVEFTNFTYHRNRNIAWARFGAIRRSRQKKEGMTPVSTFFINSIKSYLTCRNDAINDDKTLAFETALQDIKNELEYEIYDYNEEAFETGETLESQRPAQQGQETSKKGKKKWTKFPETTGSVGKMED